MRLQKDSDNEKAWAFPWPSALFFVAVLLLAPFVSEYLFMLAFAVQLYRMMRYGLYVNCIDLAFTISFSSIYRLPGGISYIVIYILLFNFIFLIKSGKMYVGTGFVLFAAAIAYVALRCGGQWELLYFIFCGMMLLYLLYLSCGQNGHRSVLWAFIIGVLASSVYAFVFGDNEAIRTTFMQEAESSDNRFRGLFLDPNYYSVFIILAIVSVICLNQSKRIGRIAYYGSIAALIFFGAQTASKSFALMLIGVFGYYCLSLFIRKRFVLGAGLLLSGLLLLALIVDGRIELFRAVLDRFKEAEDMSGLTTGRSDIWLDYLAVICLDPVTFLFGQGLGAPLVGAFGTHNILIEVLYYFGFMGVVLFVSFFAIIIKKMRRRLSSAGKRLPERLLPIMTVGAMYMFLQGISSVLFYLSLFIMYECYGCSVSEKV